MRVGSSSGLASLAFARARKAAHSALMSGGVGQNDAVLAKRTVPLNSGIAATAAAACCLMLLPGPAWAEQPQPPGQQVVDLVQRLNPSGGTKDLPSGIELANGMCDARPGSDGPDVAYKITSRAVASVPTAKIFPGNAKKCVSKCAMCL